MDLDLPGPPPPVKRRAPKKPAPPEVRDTAKYKKYRARNTENARRRRDEVRKEKRLKKKRLFDALERNAALREQVAALEAEQQRLQFAESAVGLDVTLADVASAVNPDSDFYKAAFPSDALIHPGGQQESAAAAKKNPRQRLRRSCRLQVRAQQDARCHIAQVTCF